MRVSNNLGEFDFVEIREQLQFQERTIEVLRERNEELCQKCLSLQNEKYSLKNQLDCYEVMVIYLNKLTVNLLTNLKIFRLIFF